MTISDNFRALALLASVLTLTAALPAKADGVGFFLGGGGNLTAIDDTFNINNFTQPEDIETIFDDSSLGFNFGGGWRFNKWIAIDAAYWDLGEFRSDRGLGGEKFDLDAKALTLGGIVSLPIWIIDLYARGGVARWELESGPLDDDGTNAYYGAGLAFNIGASLDIYLEVLRFDMDSHLDSIGAGVRFTF
jgi:hypothetical protein